MPKCEWCGKRFDAEEAEDIFEEEYGGILSYHNFIKPLCGDCAVEIIRDEVEGFYYETCEECGKRFDYIEECGKYYNYSNGDTDLTDCWDDQILCAECAINYMEDQYAKYRDFEEDDDDEEDYDEDNDEDYDED